MHRSFQAAAAAVLGGLGLQGCMSLEQKHTQASEMRAVDDQFQPFREYRSGEVISANNAGVGGKMLIARVDRKTGAVTTLLEFQILYKDGHRRQYETARNSRAEQLVLSTVQRQGQCRLGNTECPYSDLFTVTLPEAHLRAAGVDGYPIKIFARNGPDLLIAIPKVMITSLLAKVDADRAGGSAVVAKKAG